MELDDAELCKRSEELELQELQKCTFSSACISALDALLLDVYAVLRPTKIDYEHRRKLLLVFDAMIKKAYGHSGDFPTMEPFGSFVMDMFTAKSDLDLSLNFTAEETAVFPREKKISILRMFSKILYAQQRKGEVSGVLPILRARVPVLKAVHCGTGIECDISVENRDGISRSLIIDLMCLIDERLRILSFLMKVWAKAHDINSTKDHTLSSLSIILLVAFHLQTRDPPILPPFSALFRDGVHPGSVRNVVHGFKDFGSANKESVAELFIALLSKFSSVRSLWELGLCASTHEGFWIRKTWKTANVGVEDFLDRSQNCARAVREVELSKIYSSIDSSISYLVQFMNGQVEGSDLKVLLFGPASLHTRDENGVLNSSEIPKKQRKKRKAKKIQNENVILNESGIPNKHTERTAVPFHDSVAAPDKAKKIENENVILNESGIPNKHTERTAVPFLDLVAAPDKAKKIQNENVILNESGIPNKHTKRTTVPFHDSVAAPHDAKKMHYTARPDQLRSQIPSAIAVYPKHFVPLHQQPILRQLNYEVQDHPKLPPQHYHLPYHKPQQPLLSPASASRPHLPGPPPYSFQFGYGSHDTSPLVVPNLAHGPGHYPLHSVVPWGLQGGNQIQPPLISRQLHYRPIHDAQPPLSQSSHLDLGSYSIRPTHLVDGHHTVQFGYHNQHPGQLPRRFYQG